jgi:uncharacterized protein (DUF433 family)
MEPTTEQDEGVKTKTQVPREPTSLGDRIVLTPGTCWGKPRIAGTRIKVEQVAIW